MEQIISEIRKEINENPDVLKDIPWCDNIDKRRNEWDYTKNCDKSDFVNMYRFDKFIPPITIERQNILKRKEETERKAEQYRQDVFQIEEEINNLYNEISDSLRGKSKDVECEELTKIYEEVAELCKDIDNLTGEAALSTAARLCLKKAQMQIFTNL